MNFSHKRVHNTFPHHLVLLHCVPPLLPPMSQQQPQCLAQHNSLNRTERQRQQ
uniref:Uncharacterized protein n=1 Tax=Arundo donax TaxID=35708 RepID=A0A0A8ZYV0_ARUDO